MKESSQKQTGECAISPDKLKTMLNKMSPSERLDAPLLGDELIPALPSEIKSEHEEESLIKVQFIDKCINELTHFFFK